MNKFELINKVLMSDLDVRDKPLLIELIMRSDDEGKCWPTVERLCKARGIKHERNFKGADVYLPGLVSKVKRGRSYTYFINTSAVAELSAAEVIIKHTDPLTNTSAGEEVNTSAVAENTSAVEGANSSIDNSIDSSLVAVAPNKELGRSRHSFNFKDSADLSKLGQPVPFYVIDLGITSPEVTSAGEEVLKIVDYGAIARTRPLTDEEKKARDAQACAYMARQRALKQPVVVGDDW